MTTARAAITYSTERATIYTGDALDVLHQLGTASVDALVTDPPYSSGGMVRGDRAGQSAIAKYVTTGSAMKAGVEFTGDNRDQRGYAYWTALWLSEALRVVKPGGVALLFTDWRQLPTTTDALQAGGFVWRGIVPWHKPAARPQPGRFTAACEFVVWGSAGPMDNDYKTQPTFPGFYQASSPKDRLHPTQKPLSVMREMVKIAPLDGLVLDPFLGSGTTGIAALTEGRRFVGVEQSPHYADAAAARFRDVEAGYRATPEQAPLPIDGE